MPNISTITATDWIQAASAGIIAILTVVLALATQKSARDTGRMATQMKEQWDARYREAGESAAVRLVATLIEGEVIVSKSRRNPDAYNRAFQAWQEVWLRDRSILLDQELIERGEVFNQMLLAAATEAVHLDEYGKPQVEQPMAYRVGRAFVSLREALNRFRSGQPLGGLDELPHSTRWSEWLDAPPGSNIEDFQTARIVSESS